MITNDLYGGQDGYNRIPRWRYVPAIISVYIGPRSPTRLIERRRLKALETKEELLVVLIHIQALDISPCYIWVVMPCPFPKTGPQQ